MYGRQVHMSASCSPRLRWGCTQTDENVTRVICLDWRCQGTDKLTTINKLLPHSCLCNLSSEKGQMWSSPSPANCWERVVPVIRGAPPDRHLRWCVLRQVEEALHFLVWWPTISEDSCPALYTQIGNSFSCYWSQRPVSLWFDKCTKLEEERNLSQREDWYEAFCERRFCSSYNSSTLFLSLESW